MRTAFVGHHAGAMAMLPGRWIGLRNNTFQANYDKPQVGNPAGGAVTFDRCTDQLEISGNHFVGQNIFMFNDALELYGRNINIHDNPEIRDFGDEGIGLHSVFSATISNNNIHDNDTDYPRVTTGGIKLVTAFTGGCDGTPRDLQDVTICPGVKCPSTNNGNTIFGQPYGIHFADQNAPSRNMLSGVTIGQQTILTNTNTSNPLVGYDGTVVVNGYNNSAYPLQPTPEHPDAAPKALAVDSVSWYHVRCSDPPNPPPPPIQAGGSSETFIVPAKDIQGWSNIHSIEGVFSPTPGPNNGAQGCHFYYYAPTNSLYLDGPNGGSQWQIPSVVGTGDDLINLPYCKIHVRQSTADNLDPNQPVDPNQPRVTDPYILNLKLNIEFPPPSPSANKYIYSVVTNAQGLVSNTIIIDGQQVPQWAYWGSWTTP